MQLENSFRRSAPTPAFLFLGLWLGLAVGCGGGGSSGSGPDPVAPDPVAPTPDPDSGTDPDPDTDPTTSDAVPTLSSTQADEADGTLVFRVVFEPALAEPVELDYRTEDLTAVAGEDYEATSGRLSLAAGATSASVNVRLFDDSGAEPLEAFHLVVVDGAGNEHRAGGGILDDDGPEVAEFDPQWSRAGVFAPASLCADCHRASAEGATPAVLRKPAQGESVPSPEGADISPPSSRAHSIMAHSLDDPYFRAVLAKETEELPELAGFIEDKCLSCHSPMARTHAHQTGVGLDADGHYRLQTALGDDMAREGVSCTLCHQIQDDGSLGTAFSGDYVIDDDPDSLEIFGPYTDPFSNIMQQRTDFEPVFGAHISDSGHCAVCHNLRTATIDPATGQPTGEKFLEQGAYFEWLNSDYRDGGPLEASCQDCHMPETQPEDFVTRIAVRPNGSVNTNWPERSPFSEHAFTGGNAWMLSVLSNFRELLGIANSTTEAGFAEKMEQTRTQLATAGTLEFENASISAGQLELDLRVANHGGHKLPTSYPSRRVWVELQVIDEEDGTVRFASGVPDARGRLSVDAAAAAEACLEPVKPAGFDSAPCYEPHRDRITDPAQVMIYESVMANPAGSINHVLLYADHYLKDNRLPPPGFRTTAAAFEPDTAPVGVAGDPDFNRDADGEGTGSDVVHYRIPLADPDGRYRVEARLLYQAVRPVFSEALGFGPDPVNQFRSMYELVPPSVEEIAAAAVTVAP